MKKKYGKYFIFIILLGYCLNIIFSIGYHHRDAVHQILEFANFKLGETQAHGLAWEYHEKIRPALQPFLALNIVKAFHSIEINDSFYITTFLRFLSAILSFTVFWKLYSFYWASYKNKLGDDQISFLLFYVCLTFWFLPYCHVRFSSENWSSIFFWFAFYLLISKEINKIVPLILSGILLALAFHFRYQIGFCILGLFLWIWIIRYRFKITREIVIPTLFMSLFIILITYYLDSWFYGEKIIPALRYFDMNILQGKTKEFGESHFFMYLFLGAEAFILPFGIVVIFIILSFFYYQRQHPISWVLLPFIIVHMLIPS